MMLSVKKMPWLSHIKRGGKAYSAEKLTEGMRLGVRAVRNDRVFSGSVGSSVLEASKIEFSSLSLMNKIVHSKTIEIITLEGRR